MLKATWYIVSAGDGNRGNGRVQACFVVMQRAEEAIVPADNPFAKMGLKKLAPGRRKPRRRQRHGMSWWRSVTQHSDLAIPQSLPRP